MVIPGTFTKNCANSNLNCQVLVRRSGHAEIWFAHKLGLTVLSPPHLAHSVHSAHQVLSRASVLWKLTRTHRPLSATWSLALGVRSPCTKFHVYTKYSKKAFRGLFEQTPLKKRRLCQAFLVVLWPLALIFLFHYYPFLRHIFLIKSLWSYFSYHLLIVTNPLDPVALLVGSRLEDPTKQIPRLKQVVGDIWLIITCTWESRCPPPVQPRLCSSGNGKRYWCVAHD